MNQRGPVIMNSHEPHGEPTVWSGEIPTQESNKVVDQEGFFPMSDQRQPEHVASFGRSPMQKSDEAVDQEVSIPTSDETQHEPAALFGGKSTQESDEAVNQESPVLTSDQRQQERAASFGGSGSSTQGSDDAVDEEGPVPTNDQQSHGKKRERAVSSGESSTEESENAACPTDPTPLRRSARARPVVIAAQYLTRTRSAQPLRKKKRTSSPVPVESTNVEAEDVKPRLWTQQNTWEGTVSSMLKHMEDEVIDISDIADHELEEDVKHKLKTESMDDAHVVATRTFSLFDVNGLPRDYTFKFTVRVSILLTS